MGGGRVGAVLLSPFIKPGTVSATPYNHYALARVDRGPVRAAAARLRGDDVGDLRPGTCTRDEPADLPRQGRSGRARSRRRWIACAHGRSRVACASRRRPAVPDPARGTESLTQIKHIVVLMMENHSFDNHFGVLAPGVDGLSFDRDGQATNSNPAPNGAPVYASAAPSTCQANYTISQSWDASHQCWDSGRNDGFARVCGDRGDVLLHRRRDPVLLLARVGLPGLRPLLLLDDGADLSEPPLPDRGLGVRAGRRPAARADRSRPASVGLRHDLRHARTRSASRGRTTSPTCRRPGCSPTSSSNNPGNVVPIADFFADCAAGTLPSFSLVDPESFEGSEENPQDIAGRRVLRVPGDRCRAAQPGVGVDRARLHLRRARRLLRPRPAGAARCRPTTSRPTVTAGRPYGDLYSWYGLPRPDRRRLAWAKRELRLAHGATTTRRSCGSSRRSGTCRRSRTGTRTRTRCSTASTFARRRF